MLEPAFQTLEKLFLEFSWRRLILVIFVIALATGVFIGLEKYTAYFQLARLEKATRILERLHQLKADANLANEEDLQNIHSKLVSDLNVAISDSRFSLPIDYRLWKFLTAALPWLLFSLIYFARMRKEKQGTTAGVVAAILFGIVFGGLGLLIPEVLWPWLNLVIYPLGHFSLIMLAFMAAGKEEQRKQSKRKLRRLTSAFSGGRAASFISFHQCRSRPR
jgi:hypothetical protein